MDVLAVEGFFGVADALDRFGGGLGAEPLAEDRVVDLAKGGEELVVGDGWPSRAMVSRQACQW